nr:hypothetical protein [Tanacetum cinerariifolium]
MSTPTQWERMGTPTQCDMLCDTFWANGARFVLGNEVEVMGSRVVMEMGEKMAKKGVGKKGGKHCAGHSVLNMNVTGVSTIGDFTGLTLLVLKGL